MNIAHKGLSLLLAAPLLLCIAHARESSRPAYDPDTEVNPEEAEDTATTPAEDYPATSVREDYSVTSRPTYGGGYKTTYSDGYSVTTRQSYDGGYKTTDSDGYSVTSRPTYNGGYMTKDNEGYSVACRPVYNGGVTCRRTYTPPPSER